MIGTIKKTIVQFDALLLMCIHLKKIADKKSDATHIGIVSHKWGVYRSSVK